MKQMFFRKIATYLIYTDKDKREEEKEAQGMLYITSIYTHMEALSLIGIHITMYKGKIGNMKILK